MSNIHDDIFHVIKYDLTLYHLYKSHYQWCMDRINEINTQLYSVGGIDYTKVTFLSDPKKLDHKLLMSVNVKTKYESEAIRCQNNIDSVDLTLEKWISQSDQEFLNIVLLHRSKYDTIQTLAFDLHYDARTIRRKIDNLINHLTDEVMKEDTPVKG